MIVEYVCRAPIIWPYLVYRHLAYRKRRCVASWFSRHGYSYVLLLLVYGSGLLQMTVSATDANSANSDGDGGGRIDVVTTTPLTAVATIPKTDVMIKMPTAAATREATDDEFYDDDSGEDELLVGGVPREYGYMVAYASYAREIYMYFELLAIIHAIQSAESNAEFATLIDATGDFSSLKQLCSGLFY